MVRLNDEPAVALAGALTIKVLAAAAATATWAVVPVIEPVMVSVAVLPYWSLAVTVTLKAVPAVALAGAPTVSVLAAAAATVIVPLTPVIEPVTVSVAVTVWLPEVFNVTLSVCMPASPETKV